MSDGAALLSSSTTILEIHSISSVVILVSLQYSDFFLSDTISLNVITVADLQMETSRTYFLLFPVGRHSLESLTNSLVIWVLDGTCNHFCFANSLNSKTYLLTCGHQTHFPSTISFSVGLCSRNVVACCRIVARGFGFEVMQVNVYLVSMLVLYILHQTSQKASLVK